MKKYFSFFFFALLAMFLVGCDSPAPYYPSGDDSDGSKTYLKTGSYNDLTHNSVVVYAETNLDESNYESVEYGFVYSTNKDDIEYSNNIVWADNGERDEDVYSYSATISNLTADQQYYYCAMVRLNETECKYGKIEEFTTYEKPTSNGTLNGHEWVDLGLPSGLKWATCNVGASQPEEYGDYFAWGEVEPKDYYDWSTYKWCNGTENTQTKYCTNSDYGYNGFTDNKTTLELSDDAANYNWGDGWRMPTTEEQVELYNNCSWEWTTQNGVYGRKVTGPNGNSIFLPAAGYRRDSSLYYAGSFGDVWSSSLYTDYPDYAYCLSVYSNFVGWNVSSRYFGFPVRPVCQ